MAFDVKGALEAGYTEGDIAAFLAEQNNFDLSGALSSGYTTTDVVSFLSERENTTVLGALGEAGKRLAGGVATGTARIGTGLAELVPFIDDESAQAVQKDVDEFVAEKLAYDPAYDESYIAQLGETVGEMVPMVGSLFIPGGAPARVAQLLTMIGPAVSEGGMDRAEYEERTGEDLSTAERLVSKSADIGLGMLEKLGLPARVVKGLPKGFFQTPEGNPILKRIESMVASGLREGVQEVGQSIARDISTLAIYDPDRKIADSAIEDFTLGGGAGAVFDLAIGLAQQPLRGRKGKAPKPIEEMTEEEVEAEIEERRRFDEAEEQRRQEIDETIAAADIGPPIPVREDPLDPTEVDSELDAEEMASQVILRLGSRMPVGKTFSVETKDGKSFAEFDGEQFGPAIEDPTVAQELSNRLTETSQLLERSAGVEYIVETSGIEYTEQQADEVRRLGRSIPSPQQRVISAEDANLATGKDIASVINDMMARKKATEESGRTGISFEEAYEIARAETDTEVFTLEEVRAANKGDIGNLGDVIAEKDADFLAFEPQEPVTPPAPIDPTRPRQPALGRRQQALAALSRSFDNIIASERAFTDLLARKRIDTTVDSEPFRGLIKKITGKTPSKKSPLENLTPNERRYLYHRLRKLPSFQEQATQIPDFSTKTPNADLVRIARRQIEVDQPARIAVEGAAFGQTGQPPSQAEVRRVEREARRTARPVERATEQVPEGQEIVPFDINESALGQQLRDALKKFGIDDEYAVRMVEKVGNARRDSDGNIYIMPIKSDPDKVVYGSAQAGAKVIQVGLDGVMDLVNKGATYEQAVARVMNHEILHALRAMDLFTASEYSLLERLSRKYQKPGTGKTYGQWAFDTYGDASAVVQQEEAIAELISDSLTTGVVMDGTIKKPTGKPQSIFKKIVDFFKGMVGVAKNNDVESFKDLVDNIQSGVVGRRERGQVRTPFRTEKGRGEVAERGITKEDIELETGKRKRPLNAKQVINKVRKDLPDAPVTVDEAMLSSRLKRAEEQGFDTSSVYYHGSMSPDIKRFKAKTGMGVIAGHFTRSPQLANTFVASVPREGEAGVVYPVFLKKFIPDNETGRSLFAVKEAGDVGALQNIAEVIDKPFAEVRFDNPQLFRDLTDYFGNQLKKAKANSSYKGTSLESYRYQLIANRYRVGELSLSEAAYELAELYHEQAAPYSLEQVDREPELADFEQLEELAPYIKEAGFAGYKDVEIADRGYSAIALFNPADVKGVFADYDPTAVPEGARYEDDIMFSRRSDMPPPENAQRTQISGTLPTYRKATDILDKEASGDRSLDFGAGLGLGAQEFGYDSYEPFPREGFSPTYTSPDQIEPRSYDKIVNLNVLNVVPRDARDRIVKDIGTALDTGGVAIITTRGKDVLDAKGKKGPEPTSVITTRGTYQKGFSRKELVDYLKETLGPSFEVSPLNLGPAGAIVRRTDDEAMFSRRRAVDVTDIISGAEQPPKLKGKKAVAAYLQNRTLERLGGVPRNIAREEDREAIADDLAREAVFEYKNQDSAVEWYNETIDKTIEMLAEVHPEIKKDPGSRAAFLMSLAITSQNLAVPDNLALAEQAYNYYKKNGKFKVEGKGDKKKSMESNFKKANKLIEKMTPVEIEQFLRTEFVVSDLNKASKALLGKQADTGELATNTVYGSAIFGPKIGNGFYTNLRGDFSPVTMDMWFMRTMGRLAGTLTGTSKTKLDNAYKRFATAVGKKRVLKDVIERQAREAKSQHESEYRKYAAEFKSGKRKKSEKTLAAENLIKLLDGTNDVPMNGTHRNQLRDITYRAIQKFEDATGVSIEPAAFQALIWYPEQDLYKSLGVNLRHVRQDYATSTEQYLTKLGVDRGRIKRAKDRVRRRTERRADGVRRDADVGGPDRRGAGRPDSDLSPTEQVEGRSPRQTITPEQAEEAVKKNIESIEANPLGVPRFSVKASPEAQYIAQNPEKGLPSDDPMFSVRGDIPAVDKLTKGPDREDTNGKVFMRVLETGPIGVALTKLKAGALDRYAALGKYYQKIPELRELEAESSAVTAALMSDKSKGILGSAVKYGVPVYNNGYTRVEDFVHDGETYRGLIGVMSLIYNKDVGDLRKLAQAYAMVQRGEYLKGKNKLTPVDPKSRKEILEAVDALTDVDGYNPVKKWHEVWSAYNNKTIEFLKATGILNDETADEWKASSYVPFYRSGASDDALPNVAKNIFGDLTRMSEFRAYQGSDKAVDVGLIESVVLNLSAAIDMGMKNVAQQRIVRDMQNMGIARQIKSGGAIPKGVNAIDFKVNGKKVRFEIDDNLIHDSMISIGTGAGEQLAIKYLGMPANFLREFITRDPGFMIANMMRDTLSTAVTSGSSFIPVVDTLKGWTKGTERLERLGVVGGYDFSIDKKDILKYYKEEQKRREKSMAPLDLMMRVWNWAGEATTRSDAATRNAVYEDVLARTGNEAEASWQAAEIINFSRRGANPLVRVITAAIPFLNARFQGLDVFVRAATGEYSTRKDLSPAAGQLKFAYRAGLMASLTALYYLMVSDEDWYKEQEDHIRELNWLVPTASGVPFRIPIPFEVGLLFKTLPEAMLATFFTGDQSKRELRETIQRGVTSTLEVNPLSIQAFGPLVEAAFNYNSFTGRPIVPYYVDKMTPGLTGTLNSTQIATDIGKVLPISPLKMDHIISGYSGTIGGYIISAVDALYRQARDVEDKRPAKAIFQYPLIKRFFASKEGSGLRTDAYDLYNDVYEVVTTINSLEKQGRQDELRAYIASRQHILSLKSPVYSVKKQLDKARNQKRQIISSSLDPEIKRQMIEEIDSNLNEYLKVVPRLKQEMDAPFIQTTF